MNTGSTIVIIILSIVVIYITIQILNFYGFGTESYGMYIAFYLFLLLTMLILPQNSD